MDHQLDNLKSSYQKEIESAKTLGELDKLFLELFGKSGKITLLFPSVLPVKVILLLLDFVLNPSIKTSCNFPNSFFVFFSIIFCRKIVIIS